MEYPFITLPISVNEDKHCVSQKWPAFYFSNNSCKKLTNFNDAWYRYLKSWQNFTSTAHLQSVTTVPLNLNSHFLNNIIHIYFWLFMLSQN